MDNIDKGVTEMSKIKTSKIITIPNLLSFFRLCLIPVIVWLYCGKNDYIGTTIVLILSGVTDIADGIIARKFDMVSDFGKVLDPVADKLTQFVMLVCLITRFPFMLVPVVLLIIKELFAAVTGLLTIYKTKVVMGADWHGKVTTVALYTMMIIHLVWYQIPQVVSYLLIGGCVGIMLMSFILYGIRNIKVICGKQIKETAGQEQMKKC